VTGLDGEYRLKEEEPTRRDELCIDGCIYLRGGEEYCFIGKPLTESAEVACEVRAGG
jgi:hypothetical protein